MFSLSRCAIRNRGLYLALAGVVLACTVAGYGQSSDSSSDNPSLGDLARKQREKQQQAKDKDGKPKKVLTNEDLPAHPEDTAPSADAPENHGPDDAEPSAAPAGAVMENGEKWKAAISQQKAAIADLKNHIDKVQDSIHFVEANAYRNGVEYNKIQAQKQQEVQRLQGQLDEQQKNLEKMQESARKAGFGSSVWDP
jgi:predicted RNase H-like nuclease (RuvC/YqgF family)